MAQLREAVCQRRECLGDACVVAAQRAFPDRKRPFEERQRLPVETFFGERLAKILRCASYDGMLRVQDALP